MSDDIKVELVKGVMSVTIDRPGVHNALDGSSVSAMSAAIREGDARDEVRVVVIRGSGPTFCAGADLDWMQEMSRCSEEDNIADALALAGLFGAISQCSAPVVARVHGPAFGGGVGLIAACDCAIGVQSATFRLSEVRLGLFPAVIAPSMCARIGLGHFRHRALLGELFDAAEAFRIGLLDTVLPDTDALDEEVARTCMALCKGGPGAMASLKQLLLDLQDVDRKQALDLTARSLAAQRHSAEGQEGIQAFLQQREPGWTDEGEA